MYTKPQYQETTLEINESYEGETIEQKVARVTQSGEPIDETAPRIYTERKDGVLPEYDIRTDRFEIAQEAMSKVDKTYKAMREERQKSIGEQAKENMTKEEKGEQKTDKKSDGGETK